MGRRGSHVHKYTLSLFWNHSTRNSSGSYSFQERPDDIPNWSRPKTLTCSICGSRKVIKKGKVFRRFMSLPIGLKHTIIEFPIQRVLCLDCGATRQVNTSLPVCTVCMLNMNELFTTATHRYFVIILDRATRLRLPCSWNIPVNLWLTHHNPAATVCFFHFKTFLKSNLRQLLPCPSAIGRSRWRYFSDSELPLEP